MGTLSRPHCKTMKAFTFAMFLTLAVALAAASENAEIDDALLSHLDTTDTEDVSVDLEDDVDASDQSSGYSSPLYTGSCCKHNARWNDQFTLMCKTCAYDTIVAGKSTKKYSWSSGGKVKYEITCAKSGSAGVSCAGKNNDNGGRPRYSATCTCKPKPKADADPSGFKCNKKKRFVPGAGYSQWSSYTNKGGEAGRALCRAHFKNGASAPNGWWYQYYSNGHFNCAKFNSPVTVSESKWENTHGRPEEVCVPSAPAITWKVDSPNGSLKVAHSGRRGGWSCDQVCQGIGKKCQANELAMLKGNDSKVKAAYAAAGVSCRHGIKHDCERGNNCVRWGAPYIHNSHIEVPLCWGGSKPNVAPCNQRPVDAQHRRLCPCA